MSVTVIQNDFSGGVAEDIRTTNTNECESSSNFDVITNPHRISPYQKLELEIGSVSPLSDVALSGCVPITYSGTTYLVSLGYTSGASLIPTFWRKTSASIVESSWEIKAAGTGSVVRDSLVVYKGKAYALGTTGTPGQCRLWQYDGNSTATNIGDCGGSSTAPAKMFVHPEDNILYIVVGNIISKYDGTTFTATAFTLPSNRIGRSLTNYGGYLAIGCTTTNNAANSVIYLWGRDTSLSTVQESIDLGNNQVNIIENIDNVLFAVCVNQTVGQYSNIIKKKMWIKAYTGGAVQDLKEITLGSNVLNYSSTIKVKNNNRLYWAFGGDDALYCLTKNKNGRYVVVKDRGLPSSSEITGLSIVGDIMWVSVDSGAFYRSGAPSTNGAPGTAGYGDSSYTTTINPSMPISDRYKDKTLEAVSISFTAMSTGSPTLTLSYSVDNSNFTEIATDTRSNGEYTLYAANESDGAPFATGKEFQFKIETSSEVKIKEIKYRYRVNNEIL